MSSLAQTYIWTQGCIDQLLKVKGHHYITYYEVVVQSLVI